METESLSQQIERRLAEHERTETGLRDELAFQLEKVKSLEAEKEWLEKVAADQQERFERATKALAVETESEITPEGLEDAIHRSYQERVRVFKETTERLSAALDEERTNLDRVASALGLPVFLRGELDEHVRGLINERDVERKENRERAEKIVNHTLACSSNTEFVPLHIIEGQLALVLQLARKIVSALSGIPSLPASPPVVETL